MRLFVGYKSRPSEALTIAQFTSTVPASECVLMLRVKLVANMPACTITTERLDSRPLLRCPHKAFKTSLSPFRFVSILTFVDTTSHAANSRTASDDYTRYTLI